MHNGITAYGYFDEPVREQITPTDLMAANDVNLPSSPRQAPLPPGDTRR